MKHFGDRPGFSLVVADSDGHIASVAPFGVGGIGKQQAVSVMVRTESVSQEAGLADWFDENRVVSYVREGDSAVGAGCEGACGSGAVVVAHIYHKCAVGQFDDLTFVDLWADDAADSPGFAVVVADDNV
ncbi:hypothetical protein ES703_91903 [subsurface metagenome]